MLLIGFLENIGSERGIEARCADSIGIRKFLGISITERVPDHSSLSRIRQRLPLFVFDTVSGVVMPRMCELKLIRGKALGVDTSVIEAHASKNSLRNRMTKEKYRTYVTRLAKQAGVDTEDEGAITRFESKRADRKT
jgi:transposase